MAFLPLGFLFNCSTIKIHLPKSKSSIVDSSHRNQPLLIVERGNFPYGRVLPSCSYLIDSFLILEFLCKVFKIDSFLWMPVSRKWKERQGRVGGMGKRGRQERGKHADKEWEKGKRAGSQGKENKQEGEKRVSKKQEVRNKENQEKRKGRRMERRK